MTSLSHVVEQMVAAGLPPLPVGHPIADGKYKRFGPQKKAWYILREMDLRSGKKVVTGAFGFFQGENRNTIPVRVDAEEMSDADRAEYVRKQREYEAKEAAARERDIDLAANRAKDQWGKSVDLDADAHPYLVRKQVPSYGLRVLDGKQLAIPMWSEGGAGARLMGLQKIDAEGVKLYNAGMDKIGAAYAIGLDEPSPALIAIGEGYATCAVVHLVSGSPVVAAFDAGNIIHVARALRTAYPAAHLLLLADDDYLLVPRFIERLREEFKVSCGDTIAIDGKDHVVLADDGETVTVTAWWRSDAQGVAYIEADMRKDRLHRHYTYKNAGMSSCMAAAAAVGNASVVTPIFDSRNGEKWTDFNDLQVEQSLDAVASQINAAVIAAHAEATSPAPSDEGNTTAADQETAVSPLPSENRPAVPSPVTPAPLLDGKQDLASAAEAPQGRSLLSAAQELRGKEEDLPSAAGAPRYPLANAEEKIEANVVALSDFSGTRPLAWVLDNYAQVYGSTDVWDLLNRLRFKRSAFFLMVGKDTAKAWDVHADRKVIHIASKSDSKTAAPSAKGGGGGDKKKPKKEHGDVFWHRVERLMDSFTLIYGTDEVWDAERRCLLKINPLRLAFSNDAVKFWLNNPDRKMVPADRVMFDPTMKCDPETSVNLFNGFAMKPAPGKCDLILDLLRHLCGDDDMIFGWVLCWLAYPLQHPGAKMDTSIIMHGDEGSGKNLLFEKCIARIYGEYGGVIGNAEIEDKFNDWASKKLFVVCDEVVTRSELRQLKGKLKSMVSGSTIRINPKGLISREEANHMNLMFFSNELQPLALDKTDRRYMVIWTPAKQSEEYYATVAAQIYGGGTEALYQILMELDIGEFNQHTKPIHTEAKDNLISLGLSPAERFYREWKEGLLPLPYVCCSAMQLYQAFSRWSHLNGERFPATQTMFGRTIGRVSFGDMTSCPVKYDLLSDVRQRTVYLVGDQPDGKERNKWVEDGSATFETALRKYRHVFERDDS